MTQFSLRELMRGTGLSQKAICAVLRGRTVRRRTLMISELGVAPNLRNIG